MSKFLFLVCLTFAAGLAAEEAPRAKDDREYELAQQALAERDANKRLETLAAWSAEYEDSALGKMRAQLYLQAYREAGKTSEAVQAAARLLALEPEDFAAHYTLASLAPVLGAADEPALERARKSARMLLDRGIATQFDEDKRPDAVSEEAWTKAKRESRAASLRTLGWVAMQRKQHGQAEGRLTEALEVEPASAQTSYWLAQSILAQRDPAKNEAAFFSLARAAALTGEGELPAESREQIRAYLEKTYESFAGTLDGLDEIEGLARTSALPPPEMPRVLSAQERAIEEEKRFCEERPLECAYRTLRSALEGDDGEAVWADLRGKITPPLRLYVVRNEPAERPMALRLSSKKDGDAEVLLKLGNRLREAIPAGRAVSFEGVAAELERMPFLLTLEQGRLRD